MKWKDLKLGRKFFVAFGLIIALLILVAIWSINGIGGIVGNAEEVIEGNKLRTDMEEKYVQHLVWAGEVAKLLTDDNVKELNVQTDHHKCAFGKWYYGEGRKHAEAIAPQLKPLFDKFEDPHMELHASATKIKEVFEQADRSMSATLRESKSDHLTWAHKVKDYVVNAVQVNSIDVIKDHRLCNFGKWLYSDELKAFKKENPEFAAFTREIDKPHEELHSSIHTLEKYFREGNIQQARNYYMNNTKPKTYEVIAIIDKMIEWNDIRLEGMNKANEIYVQETQVKLNEMGELFDEVVESSKGYIMTDEVMLNQASTTRRGVILFSFIAIVVGIILASIIALGIIRPINKGVAFAKSISEGDLTAKIEVDQKDEIGVLAEALINMVNQLKGIVQNIRGGADNIAAASQQMSSSSQQMSQGASEQASSAEEVSSSMEEMASNIHQNSDNAEQTEKIALKAADDIAEGSKSVNLTVDSMKNIADKISIISEIARQTNILALNAAVEAARAGEHGKGFGVVAEEVRKLAERSQSAAAEINDISRSSVEVAEKSGKLLEAIVPDIQKTAKLVQEISAASNEMNGGAGQVNNAIQQLNQVTQQNAAASEELATSSEELSSQADELKNLISFFRTGNEHKSSMLQQKQIVESKTKGEIKHSVPNNGSGNGNKGYEFQLDDEKSSDKDFVNF